MIKSELIEKLANGNPHLMHRDVEKIVNVIFEEITSALARGDRVITPSNFAAAAVMKRFGLPRERVTVIPRSIDTATFDTAAVNAARVDAVREAWRVSRNDRVVLVPGRVAPGMGR